MAPRNIREEDAFAEALRGLIEKCPRAEDWWVLGWSWRMVRDPVTDAYLVPAYSTFTTAKEAEACLVNWIQSILP